MSAELLLSRLDKVRGRGPNQHSARCPAHDDKGPSLSVKELPNGRVLVRCFAGCETEDVLAAVGLTFQDLFPPRLDGHSMPAPRRRALLPPSQAFEIAVDDVCFAAVAAANLAHGVPLTEDDRQALLRAAGRMYALLDEVRA